MKMRVPSKLTKILGSREHAISLKEDLDRIVKQLEKDYNSSLESQRSQSNYSLPAWSEYQADCLGYQRAIKDVISLINIKVNEE